MKISSLIWVALAGGLLTWIAIRSGPVDYEPLSLDSPPIEVPVRLASSPGPGQRLRVFDVDGMCCNGCAAKLAGRLDDLDQVSEAAVDVQGSTVSIIVGEDYPVADLLTLLNRDKYTASARP
ncbi:MAG: copper chaperone CopZ [Chlamydiales bacterium]